MKKEAVTLLKVPLSLEIIVGIPTLGLDEVSQGGSGETGAG